jgi:N-acetylglutamate synthase-like GNAT family acetyltransferase
MLTVSPDLQNSGLGKNFFVEAEHAKAQGLNTIVMTVISKGTELI